MRPLAFIAASCVYVAAAVGQTASPSFRDPYPNLTEPLFRTDPEYSEQARFAGLEGTVFLSGFIADDGSPHDLQVTRPLGLGLDEKAIQAARDWRFTPQPTPVNIAVDFLLPDKQSRWHLMHQAFHPPEGATRPSFLREWYPLGAGVVSARALDEGWVINSVRRQATVTLAFDVEEHGSPVKFQVVAASDSVWVDEAIDIVQQWRFTPGAKDGVPVSVPCVIELVWGQKILTSATLAKIRETPEPIAFAAAGQLDAPKTPVKSPPGTPSSK